MTASHAAKPARRVLVHAPRGRDAEVVRGVLAPAGMVAVACASLEALVVSLDAGADIAFVTEEALEAASFDALAAWVARQPPWSDFPFVVLSSRRVGRRPAQASGVLHGLGNVVLLERPLHADTLISAARSALRARTRQYETESHLVAESAARRAEQAANAEALRATLALEIAVDAERAARLEAERAGRMKDEFLATLSHELRTPLSAILGWTHLLRRNAAAIDVAKAADTIERNARAQATLIEELLDVSRIASGNLQLEIQAVAVDDLVETVVQSQLPAATARRIQVEREVDPGLVLMADPNRLQQVIRNLLSNAIKFTPQGGHVRLRAEARGKEALIVVSDDGAGITPDFLPHVFDRFRQAESSEARSFGGLGLGLAIVRQLVELHGGVVTAQSAGTGTGAEFVVRLPLRPSLPAGEPPRPGEPAAAVAASGELRGLRILVVDDDGDGREMLAALLQLHGAQAIAAASADEALAAVERDTPDLLISDIGMPRVDGYELLRRIRSGEPAEVRGVPAIALTAFARPVDTAKAFEAGFGAHLAKPVEAADLLSTIAGLLQTRRASSSRMSSTPTPSRSA